MLFRSGESGTADFDDQVHIEADAGNFSQGGDSGSAILRETTLVALLFAGGGTATFANQMPTVFELLGLDAAAKEAVQFTVLANESLHGHAGNLPQVTGAQRPCILGTLSIAGATPRSPH